jgi:hypothetical protein
MTVERELELLRKIERLAAVYVASRDLFDSLVIDVGEPSQRIVGIGNLSQFWQRYDLLKDAIDQVQEG